MGWARKDNFFEANQVTFRNLNDFSMVLTEVFIRRKTDGTFYISLKSTRNGFDTLASLCKQEFKSEMKVMSSNSIEISGTIEVLTRLGSVIQKIANQDATVSNSINKDLFIMEDFLNFYPTLKEWRHTIPEMVNNIPAYVNPYRPNSNVLIKLMYYFMDTVIYFIRDGVAEQHTKEFKNAIIKFKSNKESFHSLLFKGENVNQWDTKGNRSGATYVTPLYLAALMVDDEYQALGDELFASLWCYGAGSRDIFNRQNVFDQSTFDLLFEHREKHTYKLSLINQHYSKLTRKIDNQLNDLKLISKNDRLVTDLNLDEKKLNSYLKKGEFVTHIRSKGATRLQTCYVKSDSLTSSQKGELFQFYKKHFKSVDEKVDLREYFYGEIGGKNKRYKFIELLFDMERLIGFSAFELKSDPKLKNQLTLIWIYTVKDSDPSYHIDGLITFLAFRPAFAAKKLDNQNRKVSMFYLAAHYTSFLFAGLDLSFPKYQTKDIVEWVKNLLTEMYGSKLKWVHEGRICYVNNDPTQAIEPEKKKSTDSDKMKAHVNQHVFGYCGTRDVPSKPYSRLLRIHNHFLRHDKEIDEQPKETHSVPGKEIDEQPKQTRYVPVFRFVCDLLHQFFCQYAKQQGFDFDEHMDVFTHFFKTIVDPTLFPGQPMQQKNKYSEGIPLFWTPEALETSIHLKKFTDLKNKSQGLKSQL